MLARDKKLSGINIEVEVIKQFATFPVPITNFSTHSTLPHSLAIMPQPAADGSSEPTLHQALPLATLALVTAGSTFN